MKGLMNMIRGLTKKGITLKTVTPALIFTVISVGTVGCQAHDHAPLGTPSISNLKEGSSVNNGTPSFPVTVSVDSVRPGIDYPTDAPIPDNLRDASMLVIEGHRIRAPKTVALSKPVAGVDFPTDARMPMILKGRKVLVINQDHRLPLTFALTNTGIELTLTRGRQVPVTAIVAIEHAQSGVDVPTDGPIERDFYVLVLDDETRVSIP